MRSLSISPHVIHGFRESMLGFQEVHSIPVCWLIVITFPTEKRGLTVIHEEICFILAMKCWFAKAFRTACFELLIGKIITSDYVSICGYSTSYFFCSWMCACQTAMICSKGSWFNSDQCNYIFYLIIFFYIDILIICKLMIQLYIYIYTYMTFLWSRGFAHLIQECFILNTFTSIPFAHPKSSSFFSRPSRVDRRFRWGRRRKVQKLVWRKLAPGWVAFLICVI